MKLFKEKICYLAVTCLCFTPIFGIGQIVENALFTSKTHSGKVVYALPGERVSGIAEVQNPGQPQIVVGLAGIGVQSGISGAPFFLKAPYQPGIYEVRYSIAKKGKNANLRNWTNALSAPLPDTTIGLIIVKETPESPEEINDTNWEEWLFAKYSLSNNG